jgi:uncharacterized repeat protein (TIGR03847 family)
MVQFEDDDIFPVTRITTGAIGEPGKRVFILQAYVGGQPFSWVIEKEQAVALGKVIPRLLQQIRLDYPELAEPLVAAKPNLALGEPLEPEFRVASIALGYDRLHDLVVLTLSESQEGDLEEAELEGESLTDEAFADEGFADEGFSDEARTDEDFVDQDGDGADEDADLQLFATRGQALLLSQQAELVIAGGRPACPNCGQPIDDFGHFCLPPATRTKWNSDYLQ